MTAEILRRAAAQMRMDGPGHERHNVERAVADLLDNLAQDEPWDFRHDDALAVARAYLGESA